MKLVRLFVLPFGVALACCTPPPKPQWLMPTPVAYLDPSVAPFRHLPASARTTTLDVFYATNRAPEAPDYGVREEDELRYGVATMRLGEASDDWQTLVDASTVHPRPRPMPVKLVGFEEVASDHEPGTREGWLAAVDRAAAATQTGEAVIYVHGAKVGFPHACAFAAEIDHFCGRDFVPIAFDWPTHREIFSYIDGVDLRHARRSAARLAELLALLSRETGLRKLHVVSWSAGARVLSRALEQLDRGGIEARVGSVVFAAGDMPRRDFVARLDAIHRQAEHVLVYISDADFALQWSARLMGGGERLGTEPEDLGPEALRVLAEHPRLEVVDASWGKTVRGFDISGHRYWFQHPWVNSDVVLALRTEASPIERGLRATRHPGIYYFGPGYEERVGPAARRLTRGEW